MRVGIATDHGGFALKEELCAQLRAAGHQVIDFGAHELSPDDDYPDYVVPLAQAIVSGSVDRGVAVCGSGVGASVCANKVPGIRAALIHDHFSARQGVEDDHLNVLCMGGRTVGPAVAWDLVKTFLAAEPSAAARHLRRLGKGAALEAGAKHNPLPQGDAGRATPRAVRRWIARRLSSVFEESVVVAGGFRHFSSPKKPEERPPKTFFEGRFRSNSSDVRPTVFSSASRWVLRGQVQLSWKAATRRIPIPCR